MNISSHTHHMEPYHSNYIKNTGWFLFLGIILVILGLAAISAAVFTTIVSVMLLGALLLVGGIFVLIDSFKFWWQKWTGFILHALMGILYIIAGIYLIQNPLLASVTLTLLLGIFYAIIGIVRIVESFTFRLIGWKWLLFSGLISLLLGILILTNWPQASLYIIGLFVGIDLLFAGWAYIITSLTAKEVEEK